MDQQENKTMAMCDSCIKWQEQLLEDGDGSQVACDHLDQLQNDTNDDDEIMLNSEIINEAKQGISGRGKKRKMADENDFISIKEFNKYVERSKPKTITKWSELAKIIYRVCKICEMEVTIDGQKKLGRYAELMERNGQRVKAWLPPLIDEELSKLENKSSDKKIYIRPLGMVISKNSRKYHDFDVVVQSSSFFP